MSHMQGSRLLQSSDCLPLHRCWDCHPLPAELLCSPVLLSTCTFETLDFQGSLSASGRCLCMDC